MNQALRTAIIKKEIDIDEIFDELKDFIMRKSDELFPDSYYIETKIVLDKLNQLSEIFQYLNN